MKNITPSLEAINARHDDAIHYAPEGAHIPYFPFFLKELSVAWDEKDGFIDDSLYAHVTSLTSNMTPSTYENDSMMRPVAKEIYAIAVEEEELVSFLNRASVLIRQSGLSQLKA